MIILFEYLLLYFFLIYYYITKMSTNNINNINGFINKRTDAYSAPVNFNIGTGSDKYIIYKTSTGAINFTFGNVLSYNNTNHSIPNTGFVTGYVKTAMKTVI